MPKYTDIKKVLVLGSGPIVIGQAAEFDYAGTQACRALKEEGLEVVLITSNPATIMTDKDIETGYKSFEIDKGRLSFRLTAPYREERRQDASYRAKLQGNKPHNFE